MIVGQAELELSRANTQKGLGMHIDGCLGDKKALKCNILYIVHCKGFVTNEIYASSLCNASLNAT